MTAMTSPAPKASPSRSGPGWRLPQLRHPVAVPMIIVLLVATLGRLLVFSPRATAGESAVLEGLTRQRHGVPDVLATVIQIGLSNTGVVLVIAAVTGWLALIRRRPLDAAGFLVMSLLGWMAVGLVKALVQRPRPSLPEVDPLMVTSGSMSFPSGHTGAALALVMALGLVSTRAVIRRRVLVAGCTGVAVVGLSRMYAGVHFPSDVLLALPVAWVGVMVGCAVANRVVPALAYGFGWRQQEEPLSAPAGDTGSSRAERSGSAAWRPGSPEDGSSAGVNDHETGGDDGKPASDRAA